jgi:hypothetical protein
LRSLKPQEKKLFSIYEQRSYNNPVFNSIGVMEPLKSQTPSTKYQLLRRQVSGFEVSGVGCQVSGKRNKKAET